MNHLKQVFTKQLSFKMSLIISATILIPVVSFCAYNAFKPQPIQISQTRLEFVPLGPIDSTQLKEIARQVSQIYHVPYQIKSIDQPFLPSVINTKTKQIDAEKLLLILKKKQSPDHVHRIWITQRDITVPSFNFVFGLSELPGKTSLMSMNRLKMGLKRGQANDELKREIKIAVHELGHTYGFEHCPNENCVMHYDVTALGVDRSSERFCERCQSRIR